MAKTKDDSTYPSLALRKTGDTTFVIVTHIHDSTGKTLSSDTSDEMSYHLAVTSLKRKAADLYASLARGL